MGNLRIKGVDISYCQAGIKYTSLKSNKVKFAIIRAGYSYHTNNSNLAFMKDTSFDTHVKGCQSSNIDIGYFWYSKTYNVSEAKQEARACIDIIKKYALPSYPVFFDAEEHDIAKLVGKQIMTDMALAFCNELEKAGYLPGIYANPDYFENYYDKSRLIGKREIWLAHWTGSPDKPSKYNYGQTIHQWGLDHIDGKDVDGDICYINYPEKTKFWYKSHNVLDPIKKTVDELAQEVLDGKWSTGSERIRLLTEAGYDYNAVQKRVNELLKPKKSIEIIAQEVLDGKWSSGNERIKLLTQAGYNYSEVQSMVNKLIAANKKTVDELAQEVLDGKWGVGQERKTKLISAGYNYDTVQKKVNELLNIEPKVEESKFTYITATEVVKKSSTSLVGTYTTAIKTNLRDGAGLDKKSLATIAANAKIKSNNGCYNIDSAGKKWLYITVKSKKMIQYTGYICLAHLNKINNSK